MEIDWQRMGFMKTKLLITAIISVGFIGCAVGGIISRKTGSAWVARVTLTTSGISCIISPAAFF